MADYTDIGYLIQKLASLESGAWEYFLKKYGGLIYKCIGKYTLSQGQQGIREEIFQEVIILLLDDNCRRLREIRNPLEKVFISWLWMVTIRHTLNFIRGERARGDKEWLSSDHIEVLNISPPQDKETFRRQLENIVIERLDPREQLVILLTLEGLTLEEIAGHMDISLTAAFNLKKKGVEKIKKYLEE